MRGCEPAVGEGFKGHYPEWLTGRRKPVAASAAAGRCSVPIAPAFGFVRSERPAFAPEASPAKRASIESPPRGKGSPAKERRRRPHPPCGGAHRERMLKIISSFTINFLDTERSAPYIGPVNARSAPDAAGRRPRKKRTKKQAGTFPLSGPPRPIGYPIRHPMRRPLRHPLRRRGLTAGPRPVRPSASAGPCCPAMPPPVSSALPLGREAGKFPIRIIFSTLPNRRFPAFLRGSGDSRAFESKENACG